MRSNLDEGVDSSDTSYVLLCSLAGSFAFLFFVLPIYIYIYILLLMFSRFSLNSKEVDTKFANYMYPDSRAKHM